MKKILLFCVCIVSLFQANAQHFEYYGKVTDSLSGEEISFVSVYVPTHNSLSTITNINGDFYLKGLQPQDSIIISHVGYETQTFPAKKLQEHKDVIRLRSMAIELEEVVVYNINIQEVLKSFFDNISKNYPKKYPVLTGVYRKQAAKNKVNVFLGQANMAIKPATFQETMKNKKSDVLFTGLKIGDNYHPDSVLNFILKIDPVPYPVFTELRPEKFNNYDWKLDQVYEIEDNGRILKIEYKGKEIKDKPLNQYCEGYVYIELSTKAVIAARIIRKMPDQKEKEGSYARNIHYIWDTYFNKVNGVYQYSYMRTEFTLEHIIQRSEVRYDIVDYNFTADFFTNDNNPGISNKMKFEPLLYDPFVRDIQKASIVPANTMNKILPDYKGNGN